KSKAKILIEHCPYEVGGSCGHPPTCCEISIGGCPQFSPGGMIAMDVVEVDLTSDLQGITAGLAVELTGVALGTSIVSA
ncbi:MAG: hypothetical protein O3A31_11915, partial [Planctomycetota bacterium]|nr:hypothetical protein [Planctomycetota bacterium]